MIELSQKPPYPRVFTGQYLLKEIFKVGFF